MGYPHRLRRDLSAEVVVHEYQDGSIAVFEGRDELFSLGAGDPKSDQTT